MQWQFICWKFIKFEHYQSTHLRYRLRKCKTCFNFLASVLLLCALPVLSLSLSPLCIWPPFSFSSRIVCHTCILTVAFLVQCSLPRRWASGWRICPPMALCRCGKTGEPSTASRTTEKYRSASLNSRNGCKTNVFEILQCWRQSFRSCTTFFSSPFFLPVSLNVCLALSFHLSPVCIYFYMLHILQKWK